MLVFKTYEILVASDFMLTCRLVHEYRGVLQ